MIRLELIVFLLELLAKEKDDMSPCVFNVYINMVMKKVKMRLGKTGATFSKEGRGCVLPALLYINDMVSCGELEECEGDDKILC